ncbi:DUF1906 domain-containing protein [Corynebacterium epidermidicanis]|uniref:Putative DUF1906 family protein n=1 Tax=Corynebacterium epidermidicanis TaxID=1050174 RepID=A0A0G3GQ03_9CORY|nr:DUF1906 domain-containing protein [Corynebacterium epidermidicanis]AKK02625.1 putative DUF1906 family protein [Corynebacterium epidermidicanis]
MAHPKTQNQTHPQNQTQTHAPKHLSRRTFFKAAFAGTAVIAAGSVTPRANALPAPIGTVIDYSAGVPSAQAVKARGHLGAVRYVSEKRPGANWMAGKPVRLGETQDFANHGLATASVYQFGRAETADWLQGAAGAAIHAPQAIAIHAAAGGPKGRPIYVAIDDNPSRSQYDQQIRPYLQAFQQQLHAAELKLGVYGNYNTIEWATQDGLGEFFWMHDWGSNGRIHPRTTIHQKAKWQENIEGIDVDINNVYAQDWGQWQPGQGPTPSQAQIPAIPGAQQLSSMLPPQVRNVPLPNQQQINDALNLINKVKPLLSS